MGASESERETSPPNKADAPAAIPDLIPVRMLNEFTYCPRLFYYEFVEGLFRENADTVEGSLKHARVDAPSRSSRKSKSGEELAVRTTAVTLSSERLGIIAKLDVIEEEADGSTCPIDHKKGRPRKRTLLARDQSGDGDESADTEEDDGESDDTGWEAWWADQIQLCAQALILEESGKKVDHGYIYYVAVKRRVRVEFTQALRERTIETIRKARETAANGAIPPPLVDDPRCPRCSLLPICLPEETALLLNPPESPREVQKLIPARDDQGTLYLSRQGATVTRQQGSLVVREKGVKIASVPMSELRQVTVFGNVQLTIQALQGLLKAGIPVSYLSIYGTFYGMAQGLPLNNVMLRKQQFLKFSAPDVRLVLAREAVRAKIMNQRTLLMRNHPDLPRETAAELKNLADRTEHCPSIQELLGLEGTAARTYFAKFGEMLRAGEEGQRRFDWNGRNKRPPKDPVNALLSLAYAMLSKDLTATLHGVGFDPMYGFMHEPRFGRPALALDLMEDFRPLVADSTALTLINNRMLGESDFIEREGACFLTDSGRKVFFETYERRKNELVTHPVFGYRVSYTRIFEMQARFLERFLMGEIDRYAGFTTR